MDVRYTLVSKILKRGRPRGSLRYAFVRGCLSGLAGLAGHQSTIPKCVGRQSIAKSPRR